MSKKSTQKIKKKASIEKELILIDPSKITKQCTGCGETKPLIYFGRKSSGGKFGRRHICKDCKRKEDETRDGSIGRRMQKWRWGATKRDIEWGIDIDYLKTLEKKCFYTGTKLTHQRNRYNTISLDRKDSSKGYIKGNVVFCCATINVMKMQLSVKEFKNWCRKVTEYAQSKKNAR